jgi:superfamily II DNA or RNA helicase
MDFAEDIPEDHLEDGVTVPAGFDNDQFRLRTYQAEMVEKSLAANIIVAMDTGSGKTHMHVLSTFKTSIIS